MNNAALNMDVQFAFSSFECMSKSGAAGSYDNSVFEELPYYFL